MQLIGRKGTREMTAEIIAVGTELLLGDILNTNAQFLARELAALGISVYYQTVVGDNPIRLESVVRQGRARSELLIFTGGLGPTEDDLTKQTVARAYGDALRLDEEELAKIEAFFSRWGRTMPENNRRQAYVPVHGKKILNHNGTAPGMIFEDLQAPGHYAVLLPGPPKENQPMFRQVVRPWLASMSSGALHSLTLRVTGIGESHLQERVGSLLQGENPTAALYAKTAEVVIRLTARAGSGGQAEAVCRAGARRFYEILGDAIYAEGEQGLEYAVVDALCQAGKTVATAESCTGGLVSGRITAVPGSSQVFGYGLCTYANQAKQRLLAVPEEMIAAYGVVSAPVAAAMAQGVRGLAGADLGLGVTGIAGPGGGSEKKPVGLVYLALADQTQVFVEKLLVTGRPRQSVREISAQHALELIRRAALGLPQPQAQRFAAGQPVQFCEEQVPKDV